MALSIRTAKIEQLADSLNRARQDQLLSELEFKRLHAAFVGRDRSNNIWAVGLSSRNWNRLERGSWIAGVPPEELSMDESVVMEIESLAKRMDSSQNRQASLQQIEPTTRRARREAAQNREDLNKIEVDRMKYVVGFGGFAVVGVIGALFPGPALYAAIVVWLILFFGLAWVYRV